MALVFNDRVKETSVTTGTGTLTLDGAVQGFETFSSAIGNSNTTYYAIELPGTTEFEVGRGTISAGQLARTEIISSSNSDSAVDFSAGTKIVFCTLPASKFVPGKFEGANFADSILIGHSDSGTLSSAEDNTGVGIVALDALTSGDQNTAVGNEAGSGITSSGKNTGVGAFALNVVNDSTGFNSAFGRSALQLVTGSYNTGVGAGAGENITSGDGNVIIGKVLADSATGDRQLKISGHDGSTTTTWISGDNTGALTFADKVVLAANKTIEFGDSGETISGDGTDLTITSSNDLDLVSNGTGTQSTLITSAGGIYLDSAETNRIDAATGILNFYKAGTLGISLNIDGNNDTVLHSRHNDKDIKFDGQDNNSTITALTLDMSAAGAATFNSTVTANAGVIVDNITIDGTEIDLSSGDLTIDVAGKIILDSDTDGIEFHDGGTKFASLSNSSGNAILAVSQQDKDLTIILNDGGSSINAVAFDASLAGNAFFNGTVTANAGLIADNITIDGTEIDLSSGDLTLDVAGDITLDAGGADIFLKDDGTTFAALRKESNGQLQIQSGSGPTTVLTFDSAQKATFAGDIAVGDDIFLHSDATEIKFGVNSDVTLTHVHDTGLLLNANRQIQFGDAGENISGDGTNLTIASGSQTIVDSTGNIQLKVGSASGALELDIGGTSIAKFENSSNTVQLRAVVQDKDIEFRGNDGGSQFTALSLDMSEAGDATFNSNIFLGDSKKANFGAGNDLQIYHDSSDSFIDDAGTGDLKIRSSFTRIIDISNDNVAATFASGGVNLRHSNAVKFTTTSTGATVTGALDVTAAPSIGNDEASFGFNAPNAELKAKNSSGSPAANFDIHTTNSSGTTARVLRATHDGILQLMSGDTVVGKLSNSSSDFVIESDVQDKDIIFKGDDGGSGITALTLDMSEGGIATFNDDIIIKDNGTIGTSSTPAQMTLDSGGKVTFVNHVALNGDLFLQHDEAQIQLGAGQDIRIIHDHNDGLVFKNTSTGDDKPFILTLQTGETDIAANDVLGKIDFQAPDEGTGTDAILVAAGIEAVSEGDFSSSSNATKLSFKTAASEAASEKMSLSSSGNLTVSGTVTANGEVLTAGVSAGFAVAMAIAL